MVLHMVASVCFNKSIFENKISGGVLGHRSCYFGDDFVGVYFYKTHYLRPLDATVLIL